MSEQYRFFDSIDGEDERYYTADEFAEYFRQVISTGILNGGTNLKVSSKEANMSVEINKGYAWLEGYLYKIDTEPLSLTLASADSILNRIDRIVIRLDKSLEKRYVKAFILKGTPDENPTPPPITRDENIYEISLAQIKVIAGKSFIGEAEITDERLNTKVCGLANSLITADTTEIFNQFQAWFDRKTAEPDGEFYMEWKSWFDEIRDTTNLVTKAEFDDYVENNIQDIRDVNGFIFIPTMEIENINAMTDKSASPPGSMMSFTINNNYIFIGGNMNKLWKIDKTTMQKVGESQDTGGSVRFAVADEDFIYALCDNSYFKKIDMITLEIVGQIGMPSSTCMEEEGSFIYVKTGQQILTKYDKATLTAQATYKNQVSGVNFNDIKVLGDYVYVAETRGNTLGRYTKLKKSNMSVDMFKDTTLRINHICVSEDGLYIYENLVSVETPYKSTIYKRRTDTGSVIKSMYIGREVSDMAFKDGFLYTLQGYEDDGLSHTNKYDSDLNFIARSKQDTTSWGHIEVDQNHVFTSTGNKVQRVLSSEITYYDGQVNKTDVLASSITPDYKIKYLRRA